MHRRIAALAGLILIVAACGQETAADSESPSAAERTSDSELAALLWTVDDLPDGYVEEAGALAGDGTEDESVMEVIEGSPECAEYLGFTGGGETPGDFSSTREATVEFSAAEFGPYLMHSIVVVPSAQITVELAEVERVLSECATESITVADEELTLRAQISHPPFPELGDRTVAFVLTGSATDFDYRFDSSMAFVQVDDRLAVFMSMVIQSDLLPDLAPPISQTAFEDLVTLAVDRLEAAP